MDINAMPFMWFHQLLDLISAKQGLCSLLESTPQWGNCYAKNPFSGAQCEKERVNGSVLSCLWGVEILDC